VKIVIAYLGQFQTVGSSACSVLTLSACREFVRFTCAQPYMRRGGTEYCCRLYIMDWGYPFD
jgi:hypothetical protein